MTKERRPSLSPKIGYTTETLGETEILMDNTVDAIALNDGSVTITWADGSITTLAAKYLRVNCACAQCVEEWTNRKLLDPATVSANIQAEDYLTVGKYAVQFLWSDGHYTGIYPYDMLRSLADRQPQPD